MNERRLEQELRGLVPALAGDWNDVRERASSASPRPRFRRRALVLAFAAAALALATGSALAIGHAAFGWFTVSTTPSKVPTIRQATSYVSGQTLSQPGHPPQRLAASLLAPLLGQDSRLAVASGDGRIAYHSADGNTPVLYVHDVQTGKDRLLARDAQTVAWGSDGSVAYVQSDGDGIRDGQAYLGRVMVGRAGGRVRPWTAMPGAYEVLAWSRSRLLVAIRLCLAPGCPRGQSPGIYELTRSGRLVPLPLASVAALSPDGRLAIGRYDLNPGQDSPSPLVRVVDVATRKVVSSLDLTAAAREAGLRGLIPGSLQRGSWRGNEVVATFSGEDSALVFFGLDGAVLTAREVIRIRPDVFPGKTGVAFGTPFFTGDAAREVLVPIRGVSEQDESVAAVLACDRDERRCVRGQALAVREWFSVVETPSWP